MNPSILDPILSVSDPGQYGVKMTGLGMIDNPSSILKLVKHDHGLPEHKKKSLMSMLNSPEAFDHLLAGAAGFAVARAISSYSEMSKPARTLLSLAGFGIGNIIYNTLHERKFTDYDPHTGIIKVK